MENYIMNVFNFIAREINKERLESEIAFIIKTASLTSIEITGDLIITFNQDITTDEQIALGDIISNHDSSIETEPTQTVQLSNITSTDNVPYVYPTTLPQGWYTCFQGAGDAESTEDDDGIGRGTKFTFSLNSKDSVVTKDYTFNSDIYLKDGYLIVKDAPLGACVSMEVWHPVHGLILPFVRMAPLFGSARVPLDTSGRAFIPKGLIIKVIVMNSTGGTGSSNASVYEDSPATFQMFGRFEIFRKKK
jgi:hypothetical protein